MYAHRGARPDHSSVREEGLGRGKWSLLMVLDIYFDTYHNFCQFRNHTIPRSLAGRGPLYPPLDISWPMEQSCRAIVTLIHRENVPWHLIRRPG